MQETAPSKFQIDRGFAPSAEQMLEIEQRAERITAWLMPSAIDRVEARVAAVFLWFPMAGLSTDSAPGTTTAYARLLSDFPIWAIDRACMKVRNSGATFRPSAPEFRALAEAECFPAREELADLRRIMQAEVFTPSTKPERQCISALFKEFAANFEDGKPGGRMTREQAERHLAGGIERGPVSLGDALKASLGFGTPADQEPTPPQRAPPAAESPPLGYPSSLEDAETAGRPP